MKKYLIIVLVIIPSFFGITSCYSDKGNYEYSNVNEVYILKDSFDLVYKVRMGSVLKVESFIDYNGYSESDVEYKWEVAIQNKPNPVYTTISTEKDLNTEIAVAPATYDMRYSVVNKKSGLTQYAKLNLEVTDAISKYTLMLLCKVPGKEGEFDISSAHEYSAVGEPSRNIYSAANGNTIKDARKLFYFATYSSPYFDIMGVLKRGGGEQLSPFDLMWQNDEKDWFFEAPEGEIEEFLCCDEFKRILYICDGQVYFCNTSYKPYKAGLKCEMSDKSPYKVKGVTMFYNSSKYARNIFWDEVGKRFIQWENKAMQLQPLAVSNIYDPNKIGDMEPIYMGASSKSRAYAIMKDKDGKLHKFIFGDDTSSYPFKLTITAHTILDSSLEFEQASAVYPSRATDALYYAVGDKIWLLNTIIDQRTLFYDFNDPKVNVVEMFHKDGYQYLFFVALNRGQVGSVYRFWIKATGYLNEDVANLFPKPKQPLDVPYEEMGPYDEIVDMQYKSKGW